MLFLLSEIECLDFIKSVGVYPDEYYTDFELFKNRVALADDTDIIILMAGTCQMSKRIIIEIATQLRRRAEDTTDKGIRSVCLMADTKLNIQMEYFYYEDRPLFFKKCENGKMSNIVLDVWEQYRSDEKDVISHIKHINRDDKAEAIQDRQDKDDALLKVIKVPEIR